MGVVINLIKNMAVNKDDITQIKKSLQELRKGQLEILLKLENLDERISNLESGDIPNKPNALEPILTCVQCSKEYRESENADGSCHYHKGVLKSAGWDYKYTCCAKMSKNYETAKAIEGCTRGRHRSKHHTDYSYATYIFYMQSLSKNAKEIWLEMDAEDLCTERCHWAEVGKTEDGDLFILVGTSRVEYTAVALYTTEQLKGLKTNEVALELKNEIGWHIRAELLVKEQFIQVTLKPASDDKGLIKGIGYVFDDNSGQVVAAGDVKCINDPTLVKILPMFNLPDDIYEGPQLDPGEDYSVNRKNDYETETAGNCTLKLQQVGNTEVASSLMQVDGKWNNFFACKTKVTNAGKENVSVIDVSGYYRNLAGEWTKVDQVIVGREYHHGNCEWFDTNNFWLNAGSTGSLIVRLVIKIEGKPPGSQYEGRRANSSLPQPLFLKFVFTDQNNGTASLQFEQGNKPLELATREERVKNWASKNEDDMLFWMCCDDTNTNQRSDVAIYIKDGLICYRPALQGNGGQYFYMEKSLNKFGYKAKQCGLEEYEVSDWIKSNKDSSITPYILVDLQTGVPYALKVVVTTATSKAIGHYMLPPPYSSVIEVKEKEVNTKGNFTVNWKVYRASRSDYIAVYPVYGKSSISGNVYNKKALTEGEATLQAPDKPGIYEVRYYPVWLKGQYTGFRHDEYLAVAKFTVK